MSTSMAAQDVYFPPAESEGGWRWLRTADEVARHGGMDPDRLEEVGAQQNALHGGHSWAIVVIRHGWLVREFYTFNMLSTKRCDVWSCTKSFTGTAWGLLLEESRQGRLSCGRRVELDSPAYTFIPEGHPLSDPRKERITIRHLLTMTSGIAGEASGVRGMPTATWHGPLRARAGARAESLRQVGG